MNTWISWALAVAAVYVGYKSFGWQGIIFALTLIAFWLLLQYSRIMRIMTTAAKFPIGQVPDARSLGLKLRKNQPLVEVLKMTKCLGLLMNKSPETYRWTDGYGHFVVVVFEQGRVSSWTMGNGA
jgi:hypothetical protein